MAGLAWGAMSSERKVFGPRTPVAESSHSDSTPKKAPGSGIAWKGTADKKSSSVSGKRSVPGRGEEPIDGKAGRKRDIDDKKPSKGRDAEGKKGKAPALPVTAEGTAFAKLPKLKDVDIAELPDLFVRKLRECITVYDFRIPDSFLAEKEGKRQTLAELAEYVHTMKTNCFGADGSLMAAVVEMVSENIFRTMQKRDRSPLDMLDPEDEDPPDPAWAHLELVYELLLRCVNYKELDIAMASKYITRSFVQRLIDNFDSEDPRERDCVKLLMNKIVGKFSVLRTTTRRCIQAICLKATCDKEVMNGFAEMLEVMGRIVASFSAPLKDDNRDLFLKVLVPLHKVEWLGTFHPQLVDIVKKYTEKEPKLAYDVVHTILRCWPMTLASKQILFLSEIEDMLNVMPTAEFQRLQEALARRLAQCLSFPNSDVAERAFTLWRSDRFVKLVTHYCKDQFPIIISALYDNSTQHWHNNVHSRTFEVLKMLMEADPELFDASSVKHRKKAEEKERLDVERERKWALLQALHSRKQAAVVPRVRKDASNNSLPGGVSNGAATAAPTMGKPGADARNEPRKRVAARPANDVSPNYEKEGPDRLGLPTANFGVPLLRERYGVAVTWDRGASDVDVGLQALVVDTRGRIIDAVHEHNPAALQALVRRPDDRPAVDGQLHCGGIIWLALSRLPEHVALLIFVVCALAGGHLGDVPGQEVHVVEDSKFNSVMHFAVDQHTGDAGVVAVIRRCAQRTWRLSQVEEFAKTGRHFMDILEPTLGKAIREAIPAVPRRQKAVVAMLAMSQGEVAYLPQPSVAKYLFVGLNWDLPPSSGSDSAGLILSAVFLDIQGQHLGAISPEGAEVVGGRHGGPGLLGQGLTLDLAAVPQETLQIFIVGHLAACVTMSEIVQRPSCCVIDPLGSELLRYVPEVGQQGHAQLDRAIVVGRFFRAEGCWGASGANSNGNIRDANGCRWAFQALGTACAGDRWQESVKELRDLSLTPPAAFQLLPSDLVSGSSCVVSL